MTTDLSRIENPIVFYHANCRDGWCSAFLAHLRFADADLIPVQHGDAPPWKRPEDRVAVEGRDVLVIDFSWSRDAIVELRSKVRSLLVLDHHVTAERELAGLDCCIFDMKRSGAGLALDFFFPGSRERFEDKVEGRQEPRQIPGTMREGGAPIWLVYLVLACEDFDLWRYARKDTREICAYLDTVERTAEKWMRLPSASEMFDRGAAVLAYQRQLVERIAKHAQRLLFPGGGEVNAVNSPVLQSEVGEFLYERDPGRASLVWFRNERWEVVCSLRSKKEVGPDVAEMAEKFGGGGHRSASGFKLVNCEHENVGWLLFAPDEINLSSIFNRKSGER